MKNINIVMVVRLYIDRPNTYTSNDRYIYIPFSNDTQVDKFITTKGLNKNKSVIERIIKGDKKLKVIYLQPVQINLGNRMFKDVPNEIIDETRAYYHIFSEERAKQEAKKKKDKGFVSYTYPIKAEEYKGKLTFLWTPAVKEYVGDGGSVWGYLGHSARQLYMDEYIEYTIKRVDTFLQKKGIQADLTSGVIEWLSNSSARHWMDSVEDCTKNEFKAAFKERYLKILAGKYLPHNTVEEIEKHIK